MSDIESQIARQMAAAGNLKRSAAEAKQRYERGEWSAAKAAFEELAAASRLTGNGLRLQEALMYQGLVFLQEDDPAGALECFKEQESICRELELRPFLVGSLGNQAVTLAKLGDWESSEAAVGLYEEVEGLCREEGDERALLKTLLNKGRLLFDMGPDPEDVGPLHVRERGAFKEAAELARRLEAKEELAWALLHEAECLDWDEIHEIRRLCEEGLSIAQEVGPQDLVQRLEQFLELVRSSLGE